jgi:hypothetical protein
MQNPDYLTIVLSYISMMPYNRAAGAFPLGDIVVNRYNTCHGFFSAGPQANPLELVHEIRRLFS